VLSNLAKPLALAAAVLWAIISWYGERPISRPPGVLVDHDPVQTTTTAPPFVVRDYTITPQARYAIEARLLSVEKYRLDGGADIAPLDFALGWGPMSDSAVLDHYRLTQGVRFFTIYPDEEAIDIAIALRFAANVHVIPADATLAKRLARLRAGTIVHMEGYLVNVNRADGFTWNSSLTRLDTGPGACELFYVEIVASR
jgi:hypothetical protein